MLFDFEVALAVFSIEMLIVYYPMFYLVFFKVLVDYQTLLWVSQCRLGKVVNIENSGH